MRSLFSEVVAYQKESQGLDWLLYDQYEIVYQDWASIKVESVAESDHEFVNYREK